MYLQRISLSSRFAMRILHARQARLKSDDIPSLVRQAARGNRPAHPEDRNAVTDGIRGTGNRSVLRRTQGIQGAPAPRMDGTQGQSSGPEIPQAPTESVCVGYHRG